MFRFGWVLLLLFCVSCIDQKDQEQPFSQSQRCVKDGANVYIRCADGRQQILGLGYGTFTVIENNQNVEATQFCKGEPVELTMNLKNTHYQFKGIAASLAIKRASPKIIQESCNTLPEGLHENLKNYQTFKMDARPLNGTPPDNDLRTSGLP